jgi:hypothetical protein
VNGVIKSKRISGWGKKKKVIWWRNGNMKRKVAETSNLVRKILMMQDIWIKFIDKVIKRSSVANRKQISYEENLRKNMRQMNSSAIAILSEICWVGNYEPIDYMYYIEQQGEQSLKKHMEFEKYLRSIVAQKMKKSYEECHK